MSKSQNSPHPWWAVHCLMEVHGNELKPTLLKKVRVQKHHWELCYCSKINWYSTVYSNDLNVCTQWMKVMQFDTVYLKKCAHGFCFAVLCCGYTLTAFPISIRLTSLALWQSSDCRSASKAALMNMEKYFMSIHYERFPNHNKTKHNKTVCIFLGILLYPRLKGSENSKSVHGYLQTIFVQTYRLLLHLESHWGHVKN